MNDVDVSNQIQQMVRFIRQEAEEKANEISVSAEEVRLSLFSSTSQDLSIALIIMDLLWLNMCRNSTSRSCS